MNTPSPELLRKALKIVDEIEKLDQQIHHLLANVPTKERGPVKSGANLARMSEEKLSRLSLTSQSPKQKKKKVPREKTVSPALSEQIQDLPATSLFTQQEQQSFLVEDTGVEQLTVVESKPSETNEESAEQSCSLY